ncbi:MAG: hypothetical protein KF901_05245 [Myxococcales bacterium]|nr:hypothetical protein [Myxococcales bacterium]
MPYRLLFVCLLSLAAVGCGKRLDVVMRHPLEVGQVDQPNTIYQRTWHATLTRLDPEAVCVDVTFDVEQPHEPPDAELPNQNLLMKAGEHWYQDAEIVEMRPTEVSSYAGRVLEQYQVGTSNECVARDSNNNCQRWEQRPVYESRWVPATWFRSVGSGVVCFANHGRVTLATDRVVFSINRVNFRWGFESIATTPTSGGERTDVVVETTEGGVEIVESVEPPS